MDRISRDNQQGNIGLELHFKANGPNDLNRTLYPIVAEYTSFSSTCGAFCRIDHILSH